MQSGVLHITIGVQFFLLVGYLMYLLFRAYSPNESRSSLMSYVAGLLTLLTLGLFYSLGVLSPLVPIYDRPVVILLIVLNVLGIAILGLDLGRILERQDHDIKQGHSEA